jgi:hypothetical protein
MFSAHIDSTLMKLKENYGIAEYACSLKPRHSHLNFTQLRAYLRIDPHQKNSCFQNK